MKGIFYMYHTLNMLSLRGIDTSYDPETETLEDTGSYLKIIKIN